VVNFQQAVNDGGVEAVLFFNYGQQALQRERESVRRIAKRYEVEYIEISLPFMARFGSGLTRNHIPHLTQDDLNDSSCVMQTASAVWIPNRNGIFLEIAAGIAEDRGVKQILVGFNREEAATFPDNSADYFDLMNMVLKYSTRNKVQLHCYTLSMDKREIFQLGKEIAAPLDLVWSCYEGGRMMCGECESCQRLKRALGDERERFEQEHFRKGFRR